MSQAHPMIQPASWGALDEPQELAKDLPAQRAELYRVIWHTSLACAMRPPLLEHTRAVWRTVAPLEGLDGLAGLERVHVAAAGVSPLPQFEGYWLERQDHPRLDWPVWASKSAWGPAQITSVQVVPKSGPTPGQMIEALAEQGIATASSLAPLVMKLLGRPRAGESASPALVQFDGGRARLTADGAERLRLWHGADLIGHVRRRNTLVSAVEQGQMSARDALAELAGPHLAALAHDVAQQIDQDCMRWSGMSRGDALAEQARLAYRPPRLRALPAWMDPELVLPSDHGLRAWRETMEAQLAQADPAWAMLEDEQRARRRWRWLQEHAEQIAVQGGGEEFAAAMDPKTGGLSALRYWLTGLQEP